jgi:phage/plasmid-like protein (TIGR03299 family)
LDHWGKPDCTPFGLVGNDYHVLQNHEAFSFFDPIIATGKVSYHTAGALGLGERIWVLALVADPISVKRVEKVEKYLLLSNGHDGRTSLRVRFTPIRVVCQNTLSAALRSGESLFKSYHDSQMPRKIEDAQEVVKNILGYYDDLGQKFNAFAGKKLDAESLTKYVKAVFPEPIRKKRESERRFELAIERNENLRNESIRLFEEGRGNKEKGIKGTVWTAYNGVTELVDHHWGYENRAQRLSWLWFGEGERIKHKAFEEAEKLIRN